MTSDVTIPELLTELSFSYYGWPPKKIGWFPHEVNRNWMVLNRWEEIWTENPESPRVKSNTLQLWVKRPDHL